MFSWFKLWQPKRSSLPLYLGDLAVVPRSDLRRFFEPDWEGEEEDLSLKTWISEALELPLYSESVETKQEFLILDVIVGEYRRGAGDSIEFGEAFFPLFWRPYVKMHIRIRSEKGKKVLGDRVVKRKMHLGEYLDKAFSWRSVFFGAANFEESDMHYLVLAGLLEGLEWARERANT